MYLDRKQQSGMVLVIILIFIEGLLIGSLVTSTQNRLEEKSTFIEGLVSAKDQKRITEHFHQNPPELNVSMDNFSYETRPDHYTDLYDGLDISWDVSVGSVYTFFWCELAFNEYIEILAVENVTASLTYTDNNSYLTTWLIYTSYNLINPEIDPYKFEFVFTVATFEIMIKLGFNK